MEGCHSCSFSHLGTGGDDACAPSAPLHRRCSLDVPFRSDVFCTALAAHWIKCPTSVQVMVSRFVGSNPRFTSVLMTLNMEPASNTVSHFLSAPSPRVFCLSVSLSLSQKNSEAKNILKQLHQSTCLLSLYPPLHGKFHFTNWKRLKPSCGPSNESLFRKQVIMLLFHGQDTMAIS